MGAYLGPSGPPQKKSLVIFFNLGAFKGVPPGTSRLDSLHRLSKRGYPNGRYQEVPPKKPQNQKMLQSFFTQGLPRVPDLQTKIEIKKKKIWLWGWGRVQPS